MKALFAVNIALVHEDLGAMTARLQTLEGDGDIAKGRPRWTSLSKQTSSWMLELRRFMIPRDSETSGFGCFGGYHRC
ncbi:Hypothetical predicted protein [Pelobates cultripes]|uniref:Uncharacterized protein n=1 Tax=Pelobates cultripes TaxID=61616 RepID=A0AAD1SL20_PELCU|nr:Hypothetical predicted protein [Pelobates cultripes]